MVADPKKRIVQEEGADPLDHGPQCASGMGRVMRFLMHIKCPDHAATADLWCRTNNSMRSNRLLSIGTWSLIGISVLGIGSVSLMAFQDPQAVMALVGVKLSNTDAYSSIRGVYGGVGISILGALLYLAFTDRRAALGFMALFWGMYAASRLMTIGMEGALGSFGSQWLVIEGTLCLLALVLLAFHVRRPRGLAVA